MRRLSLIAMSLMAPWLAAGCSGCDDSEAATSTAAGPPRQEARSGVEPWTMGAVSTAGELVLPPPCNLHGEVLRSVLARETRVMAAAGTLGRVLVGEGVPERGSSTTPPAAAVMTMRHGRLETTSGHWPQRGRPGFAHTGAQWLFAVADRTSTHVWRGTTRDVVARKPTTRPVDLRCSDAGGCGLLLRTAHGPELWLGDGSQPASKWYKSALTPRPQPKHPREPLRITSITGSGSDLRATAALIDDVRLRFMATAVGRSATQGAAPDAPHGALAAEGSWALLPSGDRGRTGCNADAAGVVVVTERGRQQLPAPLPATRASLHRIDGGMVAVWLSPPRCGTAVRVMHAAVLRGDGYPVSPVTTVAHVDDYAMASRGDRLDMWLVHDRRVSYVQARCSLPTGSRSTTR